MITILLDFDNLLVMITIVLVMITILLDFDNFTRLDCSFF
jgi:hypothetical protein